MAKFIKIKNIIFNVDEIEFISREYFSNFAGENWSVRVTMKNGSDQTYELDDEQSVNELLEQISEKLEAVKV